MLMQAQYFFMTSLPGLPALGEAPPVSLRELMERSRDLSEVRRVVGTVLLEHDLMLRQAVLSGERKDVEPVVLTVAQARGEEPLPDFLAGEATRPRPIGEDATWEAYFRHAAQQADGQGCPFLRQWASFEVTLRNALVEARAKTLELVSDEYLVAPELSGDEADVAAIVSRWSTAANPLDGQRVLDQGRWDWLARQGGWFTFRVDETAAYARGLVLLHRWREAKNG